MDAPFHEFRDRLFALLEIQENDANGPCLEVLFDMVEGSKDFDFDMVHLRLTQDLLLGAILLSEWKKLNVLFLTATSYYAAQAVRMTRNYQRAGIACPTLQIGVAGALSRDVFQWADVICHHGRVYPIPEGIRPKRTIIQYFPGEDVPHDTRSLSSLMHAAQCVDD